MRVPAQAKYVGIRPKHQSVESVDRRAGGRYSKDFLRRARERTSGRMHTWSEFAMTGRVFRRWQGVPMRSGGKWAVTPRTTDHCPANSRDTQHPKTPDSLGLSFHIVVRSILLRPFFLN